MSLSLREDLSELCRHLNKPKEYTNETNIL